MHNIYLEIRGLEQIVILLWNGAAYCTLLLQRIKWEYNIKDE
jgi:hypothetical protein